MVLAGVSHGCFMGCFRAPPPRRKTAPLKRPIKTLSFLSLLFFEFLVFFPPARISLFLWFFFLLFSRDFRVLVEIKIRVFFYWNFPGVLQKNRRKERRGEVYDQKRNPKSLRYATDLTSPDWNRKNFAARTVFRLVDPGHRKLTD